MSKATIEREEQELLEAVESGQFESILTAARRRELASVASATTRKDRRINIRISNRDLLAVQTRAVEEGIPYQTLISSVIHKYISGSLQDVTPDKKSKP